MYADPGDSSLLSRLETIEHRIDELTRRSSGHGASLGTVTLTESATSIDFPDLPQRFAHLNLVLSVGTDQAGVTGIQGQFNGLSTGYDSQFLEGNGTGFQAGRINGNTGVEVGVAGPSQWQPGATCEATIAGYSSTRHYKFVSARSAYMAGSGQVRSWASGGICWGLPDAPNGMISRLTIKPAAGSFTAGTTATLYGLL